MANESYIQTADPSIQSILYDVLYNISSLLNDGDEGKIYDGECRFILLNLHISPLGKILDVPTSVSLPSDELLGSDNFDTQMSSVSIELYKNLRAYTTSPEYGEEYTINDLFKYSDSMTSECKSYMSYAYLELFSLYRTIVEYDPSMLLFPFSATEIDILVDNLRFIIAYIGSLDAEGVYDLLFILKRIIRQVMYVKLEIFKLLR